VKDKNDIVVLSDGTVPLCNEIPLGPPQPCTLKPYEPKVFYSRVELERVFPFYTLGAAYSVGDGWQADVYVRGKHMAYLRSAQSEVRVLSALEADEGEG
jgi:hypothetical protein